MGYRSEIKAVFYTDDKEKWPVLKLYLDENFPNEWSLEPIESKHCYGYVFSAEDVKWYDNYEDVIALTRLYKDTIEAGGAYRFIRVGEDDKDIDEEYEESDTTEPFWDDFYPVTSIVMPPTEKLTFGEEQ